MSRHGAARGEARPRRDCARLAPSTAATCTSDHKAKRLGITGAPDVPGTAEREVGIACASVLGGV
jgi:hypothetical protein